MLFYEWCEKDITDTRKINYIVRWGSGKVENFTSDDYCDSMIVHAIGLMNIESIKLKNNEWYVSLKAI